MKTVKGIEFQIGTRFQIKDKDNVYHAYIVAMDANTMIYKTTNPIDQNRPRMTGFRMVEFMIEDKAWFGFKQPKAEVKKPSYTAYIMYLYTERGYTAKDMRIKFPQFNKTNISMAIQDCKTYPLRLARNVINVKRYIEQKGEPTYDLHQE